MENEPKIVEGKAAVTAQATVSASVSVERGLNDIRLAVLGIVVTIGLTVGSGSMAPGG